MKNHFPIFKAHPELIYLDSAATAQKPQTVIDALTQFYSTEYATVHRAAYLPSLKATERYNATRETARRFLNASHFEEIVFTRGTTDAINLIALSYARTFLKQGDDILISQMEHHSNIVPWQMAAAATGAKLRWIPMNGKGELEWKGHITPRTKIVSLAHISNVTGTVNPIDQIAKEAHAKGAILVVDGAQAAPHQLIDVQALDCDFYAFSGHKCYGPTGVGVLYGKKKWLEQMPPVQGGGDMIERVDLEKSSYQEPPLRFEAGTPSIASVIALKSALDFITEIGRPHIAAHEQNLLNIAKQGLMRIPGLSILGTAQEKGPLITFRIEGLHPLDLATLLDVRHIAIRSGHLCAQPTLKAFGCEVASRASFGLYNTPQDVELLVQYISKIVSKI